MTQLVVPVDEASFAGDEHHIAVERWAALNRYLLSNVRRLPNGAAVVIDGEMVANDHVWGFWIGDIICTEVDAQFEWIPALTIHNFGTEDNWDWDCWRNVEDTYGE